MIDDRPSNYFKLVDENISVFCLLQKRKWEIHKIFNHKKCEELIGNSTNGSTYHRYQVDLMEKRQKGIK